MDYEKMLKVFMAMIGEAEGTVFESQWSRYFSPEEIAELKRLDGEI